MIRFLKPIKVTGGVTALAGVVCIILAPYIGKGVFDFLWAAEPLSYIGGVLLIGGLGLAATSYAGAEWRRRRHSAPA